MSKGSNRRPEDDEAIAQHWPMRSSRQRRKPEAESRPRCAVCSRVMGKCKKCKRIHCTCCPIVRCDNGAKHVRHKSELEDSPYGFEVRRSGFADGPQELDQGPMINQSFLEQRGRR